MVKPISPKDVTNAKKAAIPPCVIVAFNKLIAEHWNGNYSSFKQDDVVKKIIEIGSSHYTSITYQSICDRGWLDIEDIYRKEGWIVEYEKGDWNSSDPSTFTFRKKKAKS